jgi:carotenoid 1,2-hydratase
MISLTTADLQIDPRILHEPGAFLWWYFDLVDESGQGLVLIWSYGLPFLPGVASAARKGRPQPPADRPSLNVIFYRDGKPDLYLLQEHEPEDATWEGLSWRLGDNTMSAHLDDDGQLTVDISIDTPVPGTTDRLQGSVHIKGALRRGGADQAANPDHEWAPLTVAARGSASLVLGDQQWRLDGRAYHDRNLGRKPLHELGIERWWWGRLAFPEGELIFYYLLPEESGAAPRSVSLFIHRDGTVRWAEDAEVIITGRRWSPYGLWWPSALTVTDPDGGLASVRFDALVDDGPFYHRYLITGERGGVSAAGVAELVVPGRIDTDWLRPLVRMRVHNVSGASSFWLPLFSGPRRGRIARLLRLGG